MFHLSSEPVLLVQAVKLSIINFLHGSRGQREKRGSAVHLLCHRYTLSSGAFPNQYVVLRNEGKQSAIPGLSFLLNWHENPFDC